LIEVDQFEAGDAFTDNLNAGVAA
jgi:hypothetical protein